MSEIAHYALLSDAAFLYYYCFINLISAHKSPQTNTSLTSWKSALALCSYLCLTAGYSYHVWWAIQTITQHKYCMSGFNVSKLSLPFYFLIVHYLGILVLCYLERWIFIYCIYIVLIWDSFSMYHYVWHTYCTVQYAFSFLIFGTVVWQNNANSRSNYLLLPELSYFVSQGKWGCKQNWSGIWLRHNTAWSKYIHREWWWCY